MGTRLRQELDSLFMTAKGFRRSQRSLARPMTVRRKTLLIIALTCLGLFVVLAAASRRFLLGGFATLEQRLAHDNVQRVLNAFDQNISGVDRFTYDRASSDETYSGLPKGDPDLLRWLIGKDANGTP